MRTIRVDDEVYEYLNQRGKTQDTFNDVLRRELGLSPKRPSRNAQADLSLAQAAIQSDFQLMDAELVALLNRHLPPQWADTPARKNQIVAVVQGFLSTPNDWDTKERHLYAVKRVAKELDVTFQTVEDKCGRQLYGEGELQPRFRRALEAIEGELREVP